LTTLGGTRCLGKGGGLLRDYVGKSGFTVQMKFKVLGGIDFQHREGSKIGSGGMLSESQERRERLRKLALETIDITKDPYFMRNHLGTFECKLCLTLHKNEGNYLAHTQGKRHQVS
jgi:splicing factor 3A subunit 2